MAIIAEEIVADLRVRSDKLTTGMKSARAAYNEELAGMRKAAGSLELAITDAATTIDKAADKLVAAFRRSAKSDQESAAAIKAAEAAKTLAVEKAAAAAAAAATAKQLDELKIQRAAAATAAAVEAAAAREARARGKITPSAAPASNGVNRTTSIFAPLRTEAAVDRVLAGEQAAARQAAAATARAVEQAAAREVAAQNRAARAAEKAARDKARAAKQAQDAITRESTKSTQQISLLAASFAAAFTGSQILGLLDSYTRFTNQLKVAGLEGENLSRVQERLFDIGQRNGTSIESLSGLYGRLAQGSK